MKPRVVKALACGNCGKVFRKDIASHLTAAKECCTCPGCGKTSRMMGARDRCKQCCAIRDVEYAQRDWVIAEKRVLETNKVLDDMQRRLRIKR